jgi:hypothetical protein
MAKQKGPVKITGTIGGVTFYKLNGEYYARAKSSLSRRRVKTDRCFSNTMRNAAWFAQASKISSAVFLFLRRAGLKNNSQRIDRKIQSRSVALVRSGMENEEIKNVLIKEFERFVVPAKQKTVQKKNTGTDHGFVNRVLRKALKQGRIKDPEAPDRKRISTGKEKRSIPFWRKVLSILSMTGSS